MKRALLAVLFTSAVMAQTPTKATTAAKAAPPPAAKSTTAAAPAAKAPAPGAPAAGGLDLLHPSTLKLTAPATYQVKMTTTQGPVVIEVTRVWAPRGADRFYNLVRAGFYTDCPFYRVMPRFMAQFGISAKPEVTRAFQGTNILDEPTKQSNKRGRLTFANSGPNTRSTTLFINTVDNGYLDPMFAPFGEVVEGMENVDKLYTGYGDLSVHQGEFETGGKAFVDRTYPKLDRILTAVVVAAPSAAAPTAPTAPAAPAAPKAVAK